MKETSMSFRIDSERKQKVSLLAKNAGISQSKVINDALDSYLSAHQRFVEHISEGIQQADKGEFVSDKNMKQLFTHWKTTFSQNK